MKIKVKDTDAVIVLSQDGDVRCILPRVDAFKEQNNDHTVTAIAIATKLQNDPDWMREAHPDADK